MLNYLWRIEQYKNRFGSVHSDIKVGDKFKKISLARFILDPPAGVRVFRKNSADPFDYRRSNLVLSTESSFHKFQPKKIGDYTSSFKGVYSVGGRWRAAIQAGKEWRCLGIHDSEADAARAYDDAALKYFGADCFTNFPKRPYRTGNGA